MRVSNDTCIESEKAYECNDEVWFTVKKKRGGDKEI